MAKNSDTPEGREERTVAARPVVQRPRPPTPRERGVHLSLLEVRMHLDAIRRILIHQTAKWEHEEREDHAADLEQLSFPVPDSEDS